jgi:4-hydroxy-2-oxoheptanedioate aldolase
MSMKFGVTLASFLILGLAPLAAQTAPPKGKRINRAVELLEMGQPVYYTTARGGAAFEEGKQLAQTKSDYINYEMEHGALDFSALRQFMRGLVEGGPTKTGHRTPAVIVTLPVLGLDEASMKANYWVIQQTLACGVHGILLCHARSPEAVRVMVEASRYPFAEKVAGLGEGFRGAGSESFASQIWGLSTTEYLKKADPWPLNKNGEIMLGLKIEDKHAVATADKTTKVPGIAFAEWGPTDMGFSLVGIPEGRGRGAAPAGNFPPGEAPQNYPQVMLDARARVLKATKAANIAFLNAASDRDVIGLIKEGAKILTGGYETGRPFTKNPWTY